MMRRKQTNVAILYRFCVYQIRVLISNGRGRPAYMRSFDVIIEELYGVKKLSKKMSEAYDDIEMNHIIDKVGLNDLCRLLQSGRFCGVIRDLIAVDQELGPLKRTIQKDRDKGKINKRAVKKYNELLKIFCKGIKRLRKNLGLRDSRDSYKNRFKSLRDFIGGNTYGDWNGDFYQNDSDLFNMDFDNWYTDIDGYDEEDDYSPDTNQLEDFLQMVEEARNPGQRRRKKKGLSKYLDDDYDEDDDDEDDYDYRDQQIAKLADTVDNLSRQIQRQSYVPYDPPSSIGSNRIRKSQTPSDKKSSQQVDPLMVKMTRDITTLKEQSSNLINAMNGFLEWRNDVNAILLDSDGQDIIEDDEYVVDDTDEQRPATREELIAELNSSPPADSSWLSEQ